MPIHASASLALAAIRNSIVGELRSSVRNLLQNKHLYQSEVIDIDRIIGAHSASGAQQTYLLQAVRAVQHFQWWISDDIQPKPSDPTYGSPAIVWAAPDIKTYCPTCKRIEPFNSVSATNFFNRSNPNGAGINNEQVFVLSYLCQSCKTIPQVFLVRRSGFKLVLSGRTPMESVETPSSIPKEIARHYSNAVVAFQSGQTLAALFMLRTLCEQWARLFSSKDAYADTAIDAYLATLPSDFKNRFPSMRELYSDLSGAMHAANADVVLFQRGLEIIQEHFEARRIFKIDGPAGIEV